MSQCQEQEEVFAFLADPVTHGLKGEKVKRIHTHAAELFLAGELVYKVKRAVRYSFLDFSTLEARREACDKELRLNARTAADIYLGVSAICRQADGRLVLDGEGEPVEWAVRMRRFDETQTLDRLVALGPLREEWIDQLVDAVVELHVTAEVRGEPYGGAAALGRTIDENAEDMERFPGIFGIERLEKLIAAKRRALAENAELLDERRARGFVRRCHGDLHLGNIVLWKGKPTPFDCIEFSEEIGTIDVVYDLAFLLMDLEVRGLRAHANRAMGRYFGRQGHVEVLSALPLMLALRAAVRAKVNAMSAERQREEARKREALELTRKFFTAAESFLTAPREPRLLAIGGLSGSGKTTLAAALAPEIGPAPGALHLRSDILRKRLAGVAPEARLPPEAYDRQTSREVYRTLLEEAGNALAAGQAVVIDAVFAQAEERTAAEGLARQAAVPFHGFWLEAPEEVLKSRVAARKGDASDATPEVVEQQLGYGLGEVRWPRIDARDGAEAVLQKARKLIAS